MFRVLSLQLALQSPEKMLALYVSINHRYVSYYAADMLNYVTLGYVHVLA